MKNAILFTTLLIGSVLTTSAFANELKRGCLKDNPLAVGETDSTLLQIYTQACDKKNKDNVNGYLAQAAQRFQQIGKNYKALQLVNELNSQQVQHSSLTDVKFLAGVAIANEALTQIREKEVRYLSDEGYAPAVAFSDAVRKAKPLAVIEDKKETSTSESRPRAQAARVQSRPARKAPPKRTVKKATTSPTKSAPKPTTPARAPGSSPFANL